jgi:hypothetical protein
LFKTRRFRPPDVSAGNFFKSEEAFGDIRFVEKKGTAGRPRFMGNCFEGKRAARAFASPKLVEGIGEYFVWKRLLLPSDKLKMTTKSSN